MKLTEVAPPTVKWQEHHLILPVSGQIHCSKVRYLALEITINGCAVEPISFVKQVMHLFL